jgi:hypothetical protein
VTARKAVSRCLEATLPAGFSLSVLSPAALVRHQLFPIEERPAAVAGRSSLSGSSQFVLRRSPLLSPAIKRTVAPGGSVDSGSWPPSSDVLTDSHSRSRAGASFGASAGPVLGPVWRPLACRGARSSVSSYSPPISRKPPTECGRDPIRLRQLQALALLDSAVIVPA